MSRAVKSVTLFKGSSEQSDAVAHTYVRIFLNCSIFYSVVFFTVQYFTVQYLLLCSICYSVIFFTVQYFYCVVFVTVQYFYCVVFATVQYFYSVVFYSVVFYSVVFYSVVFYNVVFYSVVFYSVVFYSVVFLQCSIFYNVVFFTAEYSILYRLLFLQFSIIFKPVKEPHFQLLFWVKLKTLHVGPLKRAETVLQYFLCCKGIRNIRILVVRLVNDIYLLVMHNKIADNPPVLFAHKQLSQSNSYLLINSSANHSCICHK